MAKPIQKPQTDTRVKPQPAVLPTFSMQQPPASNQNIATAEGQMQNQFGDIQARIREKMEEEKRKKAEEVKKEKQSLADYRAGKDKFELYGTKEERERALSGLNLANLLYGQNIMETGKDIQGIKSQLEQRAKGMDPISAAVAAQKQGAVATAQRQAAQSGFKGAQAMGAVANIERQANRDIAASLYGQSGAAIDKLRSMAGNMASGATGLMFGSQGQGTKMPDYQAPSNMFGSVLCTELHRQGILDSDTYTKDAEYGVRLYKTNPEILVGYHFWAVPLTKVMKKSKLVTTILKYPVLAWANHISGNKKNLFGTICVKVGQPVCGFIGRLVLTGKKYVKQIA